LETPLPALVYVHGGGWVQGFTIPAVVGGTDQFTFTYQAFAGTIGTTSPTPDLYVASPGTATGTYELTTYAVITETATCTSVISGQCAAIIISVDSGNWTIYFDTTPNANQSAGTGFLDGVAITAAGLRVRGVTLGHRLP
jgi:hypothetical protein